MNKVDYSVVIPVYNSTDSLDELQQRIRRVFEETMQCSYEIIFIDDCSPNPQTWPILQELQQADNRIAALQLMRNFGKPGAVLCGFNHANGRSIIMMDDDLQHLPEDIPALASLGDHDIVIGAFENKKHSFFKTTTSAMKNWLDYKLLGKPKHIQNTAFKLIKREVVDVVVKLNVPGPYISSLLFFASRDIVNIPLTHGNRKYGKTGYTVKKLVGQFSNFVFNNSSVLLKAVAAVGISISFLSFLTGFFFIFRYLFVGINVPGWTTTIVLLLFLGGLILFTLGILGEYFVRIIAGIEQRPAFIVRKR